MQDLFIVFWPVKTACSPRRSALTVKRIEKMVLSREQDLARQLDGDKDPGIFFEETGVDYLAIDEGHSYNSTL